MNKIECGLDLSIKFRTINKDDKELLSEFKCENKVIKDFIENQSLNSNKDVSYVFIDIDNNAIIGFCSICCTGISTTLPNIHTDVKYTTYVPSVEIDFFAIDERYRSMKLDKDSNRYDTLSNALLSYMINHIKELSTSIIGATHICLYSVPRAVNFYKRCGFTEFEDYMNPDEAQFVRDCIPMFRRI